MCIFFSHLEGEGISLLSHFLHEEFQHWCFGCVSFYRRIHLNALDPDVSPEGQTHDVQVLASIAEGTSEVDEYCHTKKGTFSFVAYTFRLCSFVSLAAVEIEIPFLPSRPDGSTLITPSANKRDKIKSIRLRWKDTFHCMCAHFEDASTDTHTDYFHMVHMVDEVPLRQVQADLRKSREENSHSYAKGYKSLGVISGSWKSYTQVALLPIPKRVAL